MPLKRFSNDAPVEFTTLILKEDTYLDTDGKAGEKKNLWTWVCVLIASRVDIRHANTWAIHQSPGGVALGRVFLFGLYFST